ncbi:probable serine/threonine-protein kinase tsuA [Condylostylus longicornis]|uniref:probable serine/threonine-protein kinase tsuA n=1 Tax=Condylostylus longicornis TaxID=2530218 RepID=UPI00244DD248|nr:probable serine/threonine-protein kinase tsuA [Condylostylus longicornis]
MDDSFFGFDTSVPVEDDGSGGIGDCDLSEPPEDVFDALNDETFGSAINGDWEKSHEHMVKLDKLKNGPKKSVDSLLINEDEEDENENVEHNEEEENYDLEISLSQVKLDDVDISSDDTETRLQLDPSVWANPVKPITQPISRPAESGYTNPEAFLRRHFSNPFEILLSQPQQIQQRQPFFTNQTSNAVHIQNQSLFPQNSNRREPQTTQQQKSKQPLTEQQSLISLQNMFFAPPTKPINIMSVEDIERNIRSQQEQQKQQQQQKQISTTQQQQEQQRQLQQLQQKQSVQAKTLKTVNKVDSKNESLNQVTGSAFKEPTISQISLSQQSQQNQAHSQSQNNQANINFLNRPHSAVPLGFNAPRPNFNYSLQHPLNLITPTNSGSMNNLQNQLIGHKNQQGFQPPNFPLLHHGMPGSIPPFPHGNFARPMPNLPVALNNFAMHPNFSAMRPLGPPVGMPPPRMPPHPALMNNLILPPPGIMYPSPQALSMQFSSNTNQLNQRLMQEIQQNHPMLANRNVLLNHSNQSHNINHGRQHQDKSKVVARANGNLPVEYDEYANLMSIRDKHWLIGIQLSQLNTETPYIDDYYYTIYKEKKAKQSGEIGQSKTHKDNQLNHPFSQPKGHAQLVILSMGKNGTQNHRNGQNNRERRNSESANNKDKDNQQQQRNFNYTPLQFENSLGKLQYGSVTAPRKIIDMEIMGNENSTQTNTPLEISAQRKSRYILLQIEILYKIVLKLEDLENPAAIATSLIVKEKKEKEKQIVLEQSFMSELNKESEIGDGENVDLKTESTSTSVSSSVSDKYSAYELESKDKLLEKLIPYLTIEKITSMMSVRKGKILIKRILPHIIDNPIRWTVWIGVFSCLQNVLKKDKDDNEGALYSLYPEFKKQIRQADMEICNKIANSMRLNDKKLNGFFSSKFCISSLVSLLLRAEEIYAESEDLSKSENNSNKIWSEFLSILSTALNRTVENQTITAEIESSAINPLVTHLSRFKHLKLDSLLTLFSQDKQQVE